MHIAIDARRYGFFGIGTYIRNLISSLARIDQENRYTIIMRSPADAIPGLPPNFNIVVYPHPDTDLSQNIAFPVFLRELRADLHHIPLNSVPFFMPKPYVVTIHDLSSLTNGTASTIRELLHRERYRRGAARASRVIAVSNSTRRDLETVVGIPPDRIRTVYSAPDPIFTPARDEDPAAMALERYSIQPPFILYAGTIRPHKNVSRLIEAFAVVRAELESVPGFSDLKLVIIGDELSRYPGVRRTVAVTRVGPHVRFLGFVPVETLRVFYRAATDSDGRVSFDVDPALFDGVGQYDFRLVVMGDQTMARGSVWIVEPGTALVLFDVDGTLTIGDRKSTRLNSSH